MAPALRWAVMRAFLMFLSPSAYQPNALPLGQTGSQGRSVWDEYSMGNRPLPLSTPPPPPNPPFLIIRMWLLWTLNPSIQSYIILSRRSQEPCEQGGGAGLSRSGFSDLLASVDLKSQVGSGETVFVTLFPNNC